MGRRSLQRELNFRAYSWERVAQLRCDFTAKKRKFLQRYHLQYRKVVKRTFLLRMSKL